MVCRVQSEVFDAGAELNAFAAGRRDIGAVVTFTGVVRDTGGDLHHLEIEHYPGMTLAALEKIEAEAVARWKLGDSLIIHRYGALAVGAQIM
ncbi:MAG: molybdenum cofactor biosynthesis protein MoaE, partial [Paracoccaceae bacterium]